MSALQQLTYEPDLLALIAADTPLKRLTGYEYAGPCPQCGGKDRLHVNLRRGLWRCRQCSPGERWGDAIDYVRRQRNCSFTEAIAHLEGTPMIAPAAPPPSISASPPIPWQAIVHELHAALLSQERPLAWLANTRKLDAAAVVRWQLGYVPPGDGVTLHGSYVPPGVTIPLLGVDGTITGIKVRKASGQMKYVSVTGSSPTLFGQPIQGGRPLLIVEGEFDCMVATAILGDRCDVATLGSATNVRAERIAQWRAYLLANTPILVCMDADKEGEIAAAAWTREIPRARVVSLPDGHKDITDYVVASGDLADWLDNLVAPEPATPEPYNQAEAQRLVDALIAHLDAHPPADWPAWEQTQARIQQACEVGDMGRVRELTGVAV